MASSNGLATFSGEHVNQALLFPMEEVFVADGFRRRQRSRRVRTQGPRKALTRIGGENACGRKFGCSRVGLIYPKTRKFPSPLKYEFRDQVANPKLALFCFPFDVRKP